MRLLVQHRTRYGFPRPAALGPHLVRLRPAAHARAIVESYSLEIAEPCDLKWQQDPNGNRLARLTFRAGQLVDSLTVAVQLVLDVKPVNPFDFFIDDRCRTAPFTYPAELARELAPFTATADPSPGPLLREFLADLPVGGNTLDVVVDLNVRVNRRVAYVIREESGVYTPEECLAAGRGSCRDSAELLVAVLRARGFAARFVSGYLIQLADDGMIPDQPRGIGRDVVDLHAWAEVYLPGAGWIGLDATSGLLCGEGHVPLCAAANPAAAAAIDGTSSESAASLSYDMTVQRLGHEARPTTPYTEDTWAELLTAAGRADARLERLGVCLTSGGEPTFNARDLAELPEWNTEALGTTKWQLGQALGRELLRRFLPEGVSLRRMGKHYPGESLPRWALDLIGRKDRVPLWPVRRGHVGLAASDARRLAAAIAEQLGLPGHLHEAHEDPWRFLQDEAGLPLDVDPLSADLEDGETRARLARVLDRGLGAIVGQVLPLARVEGRWQSERWTFRRGRLFLVPGDSPLGLRLPLKSLPAPKRPVPGPLGPSYDGPLDPRTREAEAHRQQRLEAAQAAAEGREPSPQVVIAPSRTESGWDVRTALCVEPRMGELFVFLPPMAHEDDFIELIAAIDAARAATGYEVTLEGYPPPRGPRLRSFAVTPDPGVLEVNVPPTTNSRDYVALIDGVFDAALHSGLHSEKYLVDGRLAGSGGGHHLTLGGESALVSPFVRRPDVLASLITFAQHHPSLAYLFTGLFVGPTSQAPRVDEARHEMTYELEIALRRAFEPGDQPPWQSDALFRHLLTDLTGNTHRAEISLDKLFDPATPTGRQGIVELRAFEMPPHPRMAIAQMLLARQLATAFIEAPYDKPLVRWGQTLHDRFLLPYWLWRDFDDVLGFLDDRGLALPAAAYRPFVDLRCPVVGTVRSGDLTLELSNAIEPWHVLGEEATATGTARYVDSSVERVQVRVDGFVPERHVVTVNGRALPLRATGRANEYVGGVRFRAWAPPHALHPHLGIHHPVRFDLVDTWSERALAACAYHVWHPEGRSFDRPPLTRFEADARRAQRFTVEGPRFWPVKPLPAVAAADAPYCFDLRRWPGDRPMPEPTFEAR